MAFDDTQAMLRQFTGTGSTVDQIVKGVVILTPLTLAVIWIGSYLLSFFIGTKVIPGGTMMAIFILAMIPILVAKYVLNVTLSFDMKQVLTLILAVVALLFLFWLLPKLTPEPMVNAVLTLKTQAMSLISP